jgi:hypothetical protein
MHPLELLVDLSFAASILFGLGCGVFVIRNVNAQKDKPERPNIDERQIVLTATGADQLPSLEIALNNLRDQISRTEILFRDSLDAIQTGEGLATSPRNKQQESVVGARRKVLDALMEFQGMSLTELSLVSRIDEARLRRIVLDLQARGDVNLTTSLEFPDETLVTIKPRISTVVH